MGRKCINHELRATQCTFEAMKDSLQMFNKSGFCGYGFTSSTNVLITSKIILVKKNHWEFKEETNAEKWHQNFTAAI